LAISSNIFHRLERSRIQCIACACPHRRENLMRRATFPRLRKQHQLSLGVPFVGYPASHATGPDSGIFSLPRNEECPANKKQPGLMDRKEIENHGRSTEFFCALFGA
jgi:hypothetical protein